MLKIKKLNAQLIIKYQPMSSNINRIYVCNKYGINKSQRKTYNIYKNVKCIQKVLDTLVKKKSADK